MSDFDSDLFDDTPTTAVAEGDIVQATESEEAAKQPATTEQSEESVETTGENELSGEPPSSDEGEEPGQSDKMIPEHRLKAALKDATEKSAAALKAATEELEAMRAKVAEYEAVPIPDHTKDPDGYARHMRIETSKAIMRETHTDYDEMIKHFQDMAKHNPHLNNIVADHPIPAKFAYDLAKRDKEIAEVSGIRNSEDWKQFQEWKKSQANTAATTTTTTAAPKQDTAARLSHPASKVPNLNRATNVSKAPPGAEDDELFKGAL